MINCNFSDNNFLLLFSDIDECAEETSNCSQVCINTVPGYYCSCDSGYLLNGDRATCDGEYVHITLYILVSLYTQAFLYMHVNLCSDITLYT